MKPLNAQVFTFFTEMGYQHPQIQSIILFGSRARGDFSEKSDFDIAIFGELDSKTAFEITDAVEEWNFPYKIDLVFFNKIKNEAFKQNILKEGEIIMNKFQQKLANYQKALNRLEAVLQTDLTDDIVMDATIQRFEFTMELAWKTMRAYLLEEGISKDEIYSPKATVRTAFQQNLISDAAPWFNMLEDRNITSHVYDMAQAEVIVERISKDYFKALTALNMRLKDNSGE